MDPVTLILTMIVGVLVISYVYSKRLTKLEELGVLHEKPWPILGNVGPLILQRSHFIEFVNKIYRQNEEAQYVGYYAFSEAVIMLRTPEMIRSITVKNFDHFMDHRPFVTDPDDHFLLAKNLVGLRGERWKEVRNLLSPSFTSSKMKSMFKLMSACGQNFVDHLADSSLMKLNVFDAKDAFARYTNDVIATCGFGVSVDSVKHPDNEFYRLGQEVANFGGVRGMKLFFIGMFPKISKLLNLKLISSKSESFFENIVRDTIETRDREGITRPDMIQLMMESRKKESSEGLHLSIRDMTAHAFVFFLGGFETSSTLMGFVALEIAINGKVQAKLHEEVDKVLRETNGKLSYEAINGMEYLAAVINETLRLWPVGAVLDRASVRTFELPSALPGRKSVVIEPGQTIVMPTFSIHRDPRYFADPDKFDPERFMDSRKHEIDPYAYFPFGLGPRMCIANRFALLETKVLMFHLLAKFHLKPGPKTIVPLELSKSDILLRPKGGFWLEIEPRNKSVEK